MDSQPISDEHIDITGAKPSDVQQEAPDPEPAVDPSESLPGFMGDLAVFAAILNSAPTLSSTTSKQLPEAYPEVVKRLKQRIHTLRHDASEARKAFKYVEKIIEEMQLSDGQCEELGRLWQEIFEGFEDKIRNSTQAAIQARGTIDDFLTSIVPYLEDRKCREDEKARLLAEYRETMIQGKQRASSIYKSFREMEYSIKVFRGKCSRYTAEAVNQMTTAINQLQEDITRLSESFNRVSLCFLSLFKDLQEMLQGAEPNENAPPLPQNISDRRRKKKELKLKRDDHCRRKSKATDQNAAVTNKTDALLQHADNFVVVWHLIEDNVTDIESKLSTISRAGHSSSKQVFYTRLSRIPGQYRGLMEALDLYAAALSERVEEPSKSRFTSRWIFRLRS